MELNPCRNPVVGSMRPPGDKSVTHRAILFSALAQGESAVIRPLVAADTLASRRLVESLGVRVVEDGDRWLLQSPGPGAWPAPAGAIDCANSGTTMRLAMGMLAAGPETRELQGDLSLSSRPMERVAAPLRAMGLEVQTTAGHAPVRVHGGPHHGIDYLMPVASAQVKSALLLAAVSGSGPTAITEPRPTRDHTERMLQAMGARVECARRVITVWPSSLRPAVVQVPGDPSSAAFWAALAALTAGSELTLENISLSPRRIGFYRVLEAMGARITIKETSAVPEPVGDMTVRPGPLRGVVIAGGDIPDMIDEVSLAAMVATQAQGETVISGAEELRVKESDRIHATVESLRSLGAHIEEQPDGMVIHGPTPLHGGRVNASGDHRIAMMLAVASAVARGPVTLDGEESVAISYPEFFAQYGRWAQGRGL